MIVGICLANSWKKGDFLDRVGNSKVGSKQCR